MHQASMINTALRSHWATLALTIYWRLLTSRILFCYQYDVNNNIA